MPILIGLVKLRQGRPPCHVRAH